MKNTPQDGNIVKVPERYSDVINYKIRKNGLYDLFVKGKFISSSDPHTARILARGMTLALDNI